MLLSARRWPAQETAVPGSARRPHSIAYVTVGFPHSRGRMRAAAAVVVSPRLPAEAQRALAELRLEGVLDQADAQALASRGDLDGEAAQMLSSCESPSPSKSGRLRMLAARRAYDPDSLSARECLFVLEGVAWNRRTSCGILSELARHRVPSIRVRALCNPSTPEDVRRAELSDSRMVHRILVGSGSLSMQLVRAGVLARANPWLAEGERWRVYSNAVQRGISTLPCAPPALLADDRSRSWPSAATHHRLHSGPRDLSTGQLVGETSGAAHFEALDRPDFNVSHARKVMQGHWKVIRHVDPEPHVISEIVERYGAEVFVPDVPVSGSVATEADVRWIVRHAFGPYSARRIAAASWSAPESQYLLAIFASERTGSILAPASCLQDAQRAAHILGGDKNSWGSFLRLAGAIGDRAGVSCCDVAELTTIL